MILRTMMKRTDSYADTQMFLNFWFPVTKKPQGQRMGKGIGRNEYVLAPIRTGEIFCQMKSDYPMSVVHAYRCVKKRMPMRTRLVYKPYKGEIVQRFAPINKELVEQWKCKIKNK